MTYLWYELGTHSAHLDQTHASIQLLRAVLDVVAPRVALVSETNVPHVDNISYFGDGANEAQMVYNFALPPLVVHTFQTVDCTRLAGWAATLDKTSDFATYFNFLDSHDGVGLLGARGILTEEEIEAMIARVGEHGGLISYRSTADGSKSPYEMNITWWSAMNRPDSAEDLDLQVDRYLASRSIALALRGVPGLYLIGMVASENDLEAVSRTGEARGINRTVLDAATLEQKLGDADGRTGRVARRMRGLTHARVRCAALHPNGEQRVLATGSSVFGLLRRDPTATTTPIALTNVNGTPARRLLAVVPVLVAVIGDHFGGKADTGFRVDTPCCFRAGIDEFRDFVLVPWRPRNILAFGLRSRTRLTIPRFSLWRFNVSIPTSMCVPLDLSHTSSSVASTRTTLRPAALVRGNGVGVDIDDRSVRCRKSDASWSYTTVPSCPIPITAISASPTSGSSSSGNTDSVSNFLAFGSPAVIQATCTNIDRRGDDDGHGQCKRDRYQPVLGQPGVGHRDRTDNQPEFAVVGQRQR